MYQGSPSLAGSSAVAIPNAPDRLWRIDVGSPVSGNPIIHASRIYVLPERGPLTAVALDGSIVWEKDFGAEHSFSAAPLGIAGNIVAASEKGMVFAVSAAAAELRWSHDFGEEVLGTPNWHMADDGYRLVLLGRRSGKLQTLALSDGKPMLSIKGRARCDASPSVTRDMVVFGDCNAEVYFYSLLTGELLGSTELGGQGQIAGGVSVDDDSAFTGSHGGSVFRIAMDNREIIWSFDDTDGPVYSTPTLTDEVVVFASDRGTLYCVDKDDGSPRWKREIESSPRSVAIARNRALVSASGVISIYDLSNGKLIWRREIADESTAMALTDNMIVVGTACGNLWAFGDSEDSDD